VPRKGTTNKILLDLTQSLERTKKPAWVAVARRLNRSARQRVTMNLWKINKLTKDGDVVVVPGKVLGDGELDHRVSIAALGFSAEALRKAKGKAECMGIGELARKNPEGTGMVILG
jgi:large subunit ribosomal protein L18e